MTALKATLASKPRRRAVTVAALAAGAVLALSGCGAGQVSQTATQVAAVNGNSANVGSIALRDVRFLLPQTEEYNNAKGGKAVLAFSAVNLSDSKTDELVSISSDLGQVKLADKVEIKPSSVVVADKPTAKDAAQAAAVHEQNQGEAASDKVTDPNAKPILVEVTGLTKDVTPGLTYPLTFNFKEGGTVVVNTPVDAGPNNPRQEPPKAEKGGEH
ncbi:hypothetical protein [Nocardia sp. CDC160]|uniref:hypothetical protein n=1 Tax=Nocardia sp. CDC160 TaxID=3112166 RepID=UPI002DB69D69|nr:hypothetical protein [Nocardia sp. CDC160]MEC3913725.1 hypothetical protein [Nocardia sp. CDC160]